MSSDNHLCCCLTASDAHSRLYFYQYIYVVLYYVLMTQVLETFYIHSIRDYAVYVDHIYFNCHVWSVKTIIIHLSSYQQASLIPFIFCWSMGNVLHKIMHNLKKYVIFYYGRRMTLYWADLWFILNLFWYVACYIMATDPVIVYLFMISANLLTYNFVLNF